MKTTIILAALLSLSACQLALPKPGDIPTAADLCGPFRGLFTVAAGEFAGSTPEEIRAACKLARAVAQ